MITETVYDACGCSPLGKTKQVSMPHASGATAVWTTYSYDALGRTLSVTEPDGSAKNYQYSANTVKVTDEAGKWKKYTMDGFGNLTQVQEPDPAVGPGLSISNYTFVSEQRVTLTQSNVTYSASLVNSGAALSSMTAVLSGVPNGVQIVAGQDSLSFAAVPANGQATSTNTFTINVDRTVSINLSQLRWQFQVSPQAGYYTNYSYDMLNHLTGVNMPRPTGTQTRTFNYGNPPGAFLLSATNPENGTVTYTYNATGTLASKTDAKNQQAQYSYDSYNRVTQIRHYPGAGSEDTCQRVNLGYDANTLDSSFTNLYGRLAWRQYNVCGVTAAGQFVPPAFYDMFGYTTAGQVARKRLVSVRTIAATSQGSSPTTLSGALDGLWSYDH